MAHILLVDDDLALLEFMRGSLENAHHTITSFDNGLDAYYALHEKRHFDLLLTDIVMPGMDGAELAEKAKALCPDIKILFITGFSGMAANKTQGEPVMSKPFHLTDLLKQVKIIVQQDD